MNSVRTSLKRKLWRFSRPPVVGPFQCSPPLTSSAAVLLHIPTSDGSGQACHPSVAYSAEGIGGFRYWMANTPYANRSHKLENPEVFASHDGIFWQVPPRSRNPLVPPPPGDDRHYHSDPCLLIHDRRLLLYYRTSNEEASPRRDWLSLMTSEDGSSWTAPREILTSSGALLLCPCVRVLGGEYRMWTVEHEPGAALLSVAQRKSADGIRWSPAEKARLDWPGPPLEPWHIDVVETGGGQLAMMFSAREPGRSGTQRWRFALGDGLHWRVVAAAGVEPSPFEAGKPYKASLLPPMEGAPGGWLYTSGEGWDGSWHTALRPGPLGHE